MPQGVGVALLWPLFLFNVAVAAGVLGFWVEGLGFEVWDLKVYVEVWGVRFRLGTERPHKNPHTLLRYPKP